MEGSILSSSRIIIALVAGIIASDPESRVLALVAFAWAGFGAGFGPAMILSLLWPRMTRNGALAGMATGALTVAAWGNLEGGIFDIYEILPGFVAGLAAIVVVSLLDREPSTEVCDLFNRI